MDNWTDTVDTQFLLSSCAEFMESFEESKATEQERIRGLEGNVVAILEHISQVDYKSLTDCLLVHLLAESVNVGHIEDAKFANTLYALRYM